MERLIADANELREEQGLTGDLTIESYADIIEAIHLVQDEMGITGTTQKEASDTIEGSLKMTKAAWMNLITNIGRGKDIKTAIGRLTESAKLLIGNVKPIVQNALEGIGELVSELGPIIIDELPGLITSVAPSFLTGAGKLFTSLIKSIPVLLSGLGGAIKQAITGKTDASWPEVGKAILQGIKDTFSDGVTLVKDALGLDANASWNEVGQAIHNGISAVFENGVAFLKMLLGLDATASWPEVGNAIMNGITNTITDGVSFIKGVLGLDGETSWPEVAKSIGSGLHEFFNNGADFLKGLLGVDGSSWTEVGNSIINGIRDAFAALPEVGASFIMGLIFGEGNESEQKATEKADTIAQAVSDAIGNTAIVEEKAGAIVTAVQPVLDIISGNSSDGSTGFVNNANKTLAQKVAESIGNTSDVTGKSGIIQDSIQELLSIVEKVGAGIIVVNLAKKFGTVLSTTYTTVSGWITKIGALITKHPIISAIIGGAYLSQKIDEWSIERDYGDYFAAEGNLDSLMQETGNAEVSRLQDYLGRLHNYSTGEGEDMLVDQMDAFREELSNPETGLWSLISELLPDSTEVGQITSALGEGLSWDDIINGDAGPIDWEMLATNAFTAVADKINEEMANGGGDSSLDLTSIQDAIANAAIDGSDTMQTDIETAVDDAATYLQTTLQAALDGLVIPDFTGGAGKDYGTGRKKKHATALDDGEILHGLTPFGIDDSGVVHYGGESPEAVVGVSSLNTMIQKSVKSAFDTLKGSTSDRPITVQLVLDTGVLLSEVDVGLAERANWRGGGRA